MINVKPFIYRNARPLDLAIFRYHFENGDINEVLNALSYYQNDDGGFAHAIEPDNWNENSNPVGTWAAAMILREIHFVDASHPIIQGILRYLDSMESFANGKWMNTVPSNNDYPHAVWWHCDGDGDPADNPTVALAGFILRFANKSSALYEKACVIVKQAIKNFMENPTDEWHTVRCYTDLIAYCEEIKGFDVFPLDEFRNAIINKVNAVICSDSNKWAAEYVCTPSFFSFRENPIVRYIPRELCEKESKLLITKQLPDGSFPITWKWHNDYKEFEISANWWRSDIIIRNLKFIKTYGNQEVQL